MRTLGGLVFSLFFLGFFLNGLPKAQASEVSQEPSKLKFRFLLVQYQRLENGYDPQAIMNKWTGKVLNEQTQMRKSNQASSLYGDGVREYSESSYAYPSQATEVQMPYPPAQAHPGAQFQSPYPPSYSVPPAYGPQPYGPQPYGSYSPQAPSPYQMPSGYGQPGFHPYPSNPQPFYPPQAPYPQMYPQTPGNCFCA